MTHVLDNAVWSALNGEHKRFAETYGQARRYQADVAPFHVLPPSPGPSAWADLAELVGPGRELMMGGGVPVPPPEGWEIVFHLDGVQLAGASVRGVADPDAVRLGAVDLPEILELVKRTEPGPFRERTIELGTYLGIRRGGVLVAMAGERLHPDGWTEISAVCTDPAWRGQGLARRLILALVAGIRERGELPFLHAAATNTGAIRLYEALGFEVRQHTAFRVLRTPGA